MVVLPAALAGLTRLPSTAWQGMRDTLVPGHPGSASRRVVQVRPGRAHLGVRGVHLPGREELARAAEAALEAVEGVNWAEVNPVLAEVAISFEDGTVDVDDLAGILESVEDAHGVSDEEFLPGQPGHPADEAPVRRGVAALAADAVGVGISVAGRVLRLPALPVEVASVVPALDSLPPVRRALDARPAVDTAAMLLNAALQGLGQGPLGLLVDAAHRVALVTELAARRSAWLAAENRLVPGPPGHRPAAAPPEPRPGPLPEGPAGRYAKVASLASLAGGGVALAASRDPRRAADVVLAGLPRATRLGVDGFASQLGRDLSAREVIPMDPSVLRLLDRVDTVVLDAASMVTGRATVASVVVLVGDGSEDGRARSMFDPDSPDAPRRLGKWALSPPGDDGLAWPRGARTRVRRMAGRGQRVLALSREGAVTALVAAAPELHACAGEVAAAARRCGHHLVVAGAREGVAEALGADRAVPGGAHAARSVRALQAEGRVVAYVSARAGGALRAADCGIGVLDPRAGHPPWGADLICLHLAEAASVIEATRLAAEASRRAAAIAGAGSAAATLLALGPLPLAGRRAVTAVQLSSLAALGVGTWTAAQLPPSPPRRDEAPAPWHAMGAADVLDRLGTTAGGLSSEAAEGRREPEVRAAPPGLGALVAGELANPLAAILGAGAALSAAAGSAVDAALIAGVIGADAVLGAAQRMRTEAAIGRLGAAVVNGSVKVLRDGEEAVSEAASLVPGDVVQLAAGDAVPADCRVLDSAGLETDESSLTGESLPVGKYPSPVPPGTTVAERRSMVYAGTAVAAGRATAVVVATGAGTEARRGAAPAAARGGATGVEARMRALTDLTVPVVLAAGGGLAANSLLRGRPAREALTAGVSLAAAAVPEGLPFVATAAEAGAARRLAGRGVLVRNAGVLEALGRVDVLCFDKTGTLTEGRLRLRTVSDGEIEEPVDGLGEPRRRVLAAALRASPRPRARGYSHPTDGAVAEGGAAAGVAPGTGCPGWRKAASLPFEPGRGYYASLGRTRAGALVSVKGAPEVVLPRCVTWRRQAGPPLALDGPARDRLAAEVDRLARQGLRVLAVAERAASDRDGIDDARVDRLELLGFVGVADVARLSASGPLAELQGAGINVVMVTGDHPSTAEAVASDLGILNGRRVVSGPELEALDDAELTAVAAHAAVFARVTPADKVRIVAAFQRAGMVVAMTGDGANDAQAIRLAEIGVAFGPRATAAAREAADLVVTSGDVGVLVDAVVEGRVMWASVRDAVSVLLGGNLGEIAFTTGAAVLTGRTPLTARQLLAVNLFTDLAPAMALAVQAPSARRVDLASEGPDTSLGGRLARDVGIRAAATSAAAFGAWTTARLTGGPARARTVALGALVGAQLGQTLVIGRRSPLVVGTALVSAGALAAVVQVPGLSRFFGCRPLGPVGWTIVGASSALGTAGALAAEALLPDFGHDSRPPQPPPA